MQILGCCDYVLVYPSHHCGKLLALVVYGTRPLKPVIGCSDDVGACHCCSQAQWYSSAGSSGGLYGGVQALFVILTYLKVLSTNLNNSDNLFKLCCINTVCDKYIPCDNIWHCNTFTLNTVVVK